MPCPGNHELEFDNGPQGLNSYLTRYTLPRNGDPAFAGRWYSFRVSNALFISLAADDVVYQDGAAFVAGPAPLVPAPVTGNPPIPPGSSLYVRGYSGGAQTRWLERTLARGPAGPGIDWIIVQMHQDALSSSITGNGSDLGIRQEWLPLFDRYRRRPRPVRARPRLRALLPGPRLSTRTPGGTTPPAPPSRRSGRIRSPPWTTGSIDTSNGTVHLILGGGGTNAPSTNTASTPLTTKREAKIFTKPNLPAAHRHRPGVYTRAAADAREDAVWSAVRDPSTGYGIAVFDVDPAAGNLTTIDVTYLHAVGADPVNPTTGAAGAPTPNYSVFETFTLFRPLHHRGFRRRSNGLETITR